MNCQSKLMLFALITFAAWLLCACQAEAPAPKQSSTQNLLAQVEAIEADESALLFQQAKAAAKKDNVIEARSLIQQALGRGAGASGMAAAEAEIKKAEVRIAAQIAEAKREAESSRRAQEIADEINALGNFSSSSSPSSNSSDTFCWSIKNDDARHACLNKPYQTKNEDARKILLGNCHSLSRSADSQGFTSVCARGESGCYSLKNQSLHYPCQSCNGSTQWAATAVAGSVFQCN